MFAQHQPLIGHWARKCPANLCEVVRFAIISAQQPLYRVPIDMEVCHAHEPAADGILFAWKAYAWDQAETRARDHYWHATDIWHTFEQGHASESETTRALVSYLASDVAGLGLAKAGFVAQLAFGLCGCLDAHNFRRFGLAPGAFDHFRRLKTAKARQRKVDQYVTFCETIGGCEYLWDSWCAYVASESKMANAYDDAEHVSRIHCEAFGLLP